MDEKEKKIEKRNLPAEIRRVEETRKKNRDRYDWAGNHDERRA